MSQRLLRSMATTSSLQDPTNGIIFKFPFSQPLTTSSLPNDDGRFPRQSPRQPPERNFVNIAPLLNSTLDFETTYIENSLHVPDDEDDFKNNQTTYLTVIDDISDEASSIESSQDDLFSEIDKEVALKRKEFIKQGLLKPNPAKEDIADVIHAELQPYEVDDAEEIEQLKGLAVNYDETPEDLLGSNSDSLFDLDFDSLVKSKKARIVEPRFQMTLAELLDESKMVPVSIYGNLEVDISGIQHDSRLATSGDTGKFVFTTSQILRMAKKLGQLAMLDSLQLLHFNIGYQIPITELFAAGVGEASQIYYELLRFGAQMKVFDIGGGLGIDYDGSKSADSDIFVVHDLEEYVVAVVQAVKDVCDCRSAKHPVICSDSGRAIASHHSKPSKSDLNYESGLDPELSLNIYVQRDERSGHLKMSDFLAYTLKSIVQVLKPELEFLFDSPPKEFDSFEDVLKLYESGMDVPEGILKDVRDNIHGEMLKVIFSTVREKFLKFHGFPTKKVISEGEYHSEFSQLVSYIFMDQIFNIVTCSSHATTLLLFDTHYNAALDKFGFARKLDKLKKKMESKRRVIYFDDKHTLLRFYSVHPIAKCKHIHIILQTTSVAILVTMLLDPTIIGGHCYVSCVIGGLHYKQWDPGAVFIKEFMFNVLK